MVKEDKLLISFYDGVLQFFMLLKEMKAIFKSCPWLTYQKIYQSKVTTLQIQKIGLPRDHRIDLKKKETLKFFTLYTFFKKLLLQKLLSHVHNNYTDRYKITTECFQLNEEEQRWQKQWNFSILRFRNGK